MGVLIDKRRFTEGEIYKIIFVDHNSCAFEMVRDKELCRLKFQDGESLIDKLCEAFINSNDYKLYYRRLVFDVLTRGYGHNNKFMYDIIHKLNVACTSEKNESNKRDISCLINILNTYKNRINGYQISDSQKKIMNFFSISDIFPRNLEKVSRESYPNNVSRVSDKIITIDSRKSTDFNSFVVYEDAFSIRENSQGYLLSIFISDVASYIMNCPNLYQTALQRAESIYLKKDVHNIHMFPDYIRKMCSLSSLSTKYAVGHFFQFSPDFELIDSRISAVKVKVSKNYTYDQVDMIIHGKKKALDKKDEDIHEMINLLLEITKKLESQFNLGYHSFKEKVYGKENSYSQAAHITEVLSLFLNSYIAQSMYERWLPCIYKNNISDLTIGLLNSSYYSLYPQGHVGNNGNPYCQVTKPIRDFASLLNQYFELVFLVNRVYDSEIIKEWLAILINIIPELNTRVSLNAEYRDIIETIGSASIINRDKGIRKRLTR